MVLAQQTSQLTGLARQLVMQNLLNEEDAKGAINAAQKGKLPFVQYITSKNLVKSIDVATIASTEFGTPILDISIVDIEKETVRVIKEALVTKHHALPVFKRGNQLFVAVADPTNIGALDEIKFHTRYQI